MSFLWQDQVQFSAQGQQLTHFPEGSERVVDVLKNVSAKDNIPSFSRHLIYSIIDWDAATSTALSSFTADVPTFRLGERCYTLPNATPVFEDTLVPLVIGKVESS